MLTEGTVQSVTKSVAGSELASGASAGATSITVVDIDEFDPDGGTLTIGDVAGEGGEQHDYTVPDEFGTTLDLATALSSSHSAGERVDLYPLAVEWWADILEPDGQEPLTARVPHSLVPLLATGVRTPTTAEKVEADFAGVDLLVSDVVQQAPNLDGTFLKAESITGIHIKAGTIAALHINVSSLSAINADLGDITAGTLTAVTTQTSNSDPRAIFDSAGFRLTESDGTVAFSVAGGNGITFKADAGEGISVSREVRWLQAGAKIGEATSWESGGVDVMLMQATRRSTNEARAIVSAADGGSHQASQLQVSQTGAVGDVTAQTPAGSALILDESGNSRFPKLPLASDHTVNRGVATITWPGASTLSDTITVTHNLGSTPTCVVCNYGSTVAVIGVTSLGSTTFQIRARTVDESQPSGATSVSAYWVAWT